MFWVFRSQESHIFGKLNFLATTMAARSCTETCVAPDARKRAVAWCCFILKFNHGWSIYVFVWSCLIHVCPLLRFLRLFGLDWFGNPPQVPITFHPIAGKGMRGRSNAGTTCYQHLSTYYNILQPSTTHNHYKMEATNPQKEWLPETSWLYRMGTTTPQKGVSCQKGHHYKMDFNIVKSKSSCPPGVTIKWKYQPPGKKPR